MCNKEKFWPLLCAAIDRPHWASHADFRSFADRLKHRAQHTEMLDAALGERTTAQRLERFASSVPAAPVNDLAAALDNPFVGERAIASVPHPERADFRMLVDVGGDERPKQAAPPLGRDTDAILAACGFSPARIAALRQARVIEPSPIARECPTATAPSTMGRVSRRA
jgi:succinate--hydroxymethylglutarate CoA-transferase